MNRRSNGLAGIHHVSALSARIARSRDFYVRVLGMRPLVTTVNQDDPRMYHLFFGDGAGSTGSGMTVFDMPHAAREHHGHGSISRTTFRVAGESLEYWLERFRTLAVSSAELSTRDGRPVLDLDDPEGTRLSLVADDATGNHHPWLASSVPTAHQIRGLGYTTITVPSLEPTHRFLTEALGLSTSRVYMTGDDDRFQVHVYSMGEDGVHAEVHVMARDDIPRARYGAGGVHHVALRVPRDADIHSWSDRLHDAGYGNSGVVDRHWFRSVYVREPNHVLFELATDEPGFAHGSALQHQGLLLPPHLEPRRAEIEANLSPLDLSDAA